MNLSVQKGEFDHCKNGDWNELTGETKTELLKYLELDVRGLQELSNVLHDGCVESFHTSWVHYFSTSQMTYSIWTNEIAEEYIQTKSYYYLVKSCIH